MPSTPDPIQYLDAAAASAPARRYKRWLLDALDLRRGQNVLDVGCGPGTDLADLAAAVGGSGEVIGIDRDPAMVAEARRRTADHANVTVHDGDANALPLDDACADRARVDRVLQHLADPAGALAELRRVLCPGGVLGMAEPDWDTLVVDGVDTATSRAYTRFIADGRRNGTIGRQLPRLATAAGFTVRAVDATAVVFDDFAAAEEILGLRRNVDRAVEAGAFDADRGRAWLDGMHSGPFLAAFTFFTATATVPG
jgi:SAM-dependent methyltransferase